MRIATTRGYALAHDEGQTILSMGERLTLKATRALTNYGFTLIENLVAPGSESLPHLHQNEDEAFYILEGEMNVTVGDETFHAKPGSFVFLPRCVPHHWQVLGGSPVRFLLFFTISAIEGFFIETVTQVNRPQPTPSARQYVAKLCSRQSTINAKNGASLPCTCTSSSAA